MLREIIGPLFVIALVGPGWSSASAPEYPRLASTTSCTDRFITSRRNYALNVPATSSVTHRSYIRSAEECKSLCLQYKECRSATFRASATGADRCYLNRKNHIDDGVTIQRVSSTYQMTIFERDCSVPIPVPTSCSSVFHPEIQNFVLQVSESNALQIETNVWDIHSCKELCLYHDSCRSVTYQPSKKKCFLNPVNARDDGVRKVQVNGGFTLVERKCSEPLCGIQSAKYPPKPDSHRIVGGEEANPHSWPWVVSLMDGNHTLCSGSILSKRWIATAAHCVIRGPLHGPFFKILAGAHHKRHKEESKRIHSVIETHTHPGFGHSHYGRANDLALLELATDLEFSDEIMPICLPHDDDGDLPEDDFVVVGWGRTRGTGNNGVLNQIYLPLIPYRTCSRPDYYGLRVNSDTMICAGYDMGGRDACRGDSGGPLMHKDETADGPARYRLYGITSWGRGCARPKRPGVYTNVRHFLNWIQVETNNAAQSP